MTINEFSRFVLSKSSGRIELPENQRFVDRVMSGLMRIAMDTVPLRLTVQDPDGVEILRRIDEFTYIRKPSRPILDSGLDIDIDDELIDALGNYVMAGLEMQRAKVLMGMYHSCIDFYNDKLTETFLAVATNDAERFHVFP